MQENVEIVRRCLHLLGAQEFSGLARLVGPEVVLDLSRNLDSTSYQGIDGLRRWMQEVEETWEDFRVEPEELIDLGEDVVTCARISGRGRGSGAEAEMRVFQIWQLRKGRVLRVTGGYRDRAEAIRDANAGL